MWVECSWVLANITSKSSHYFRKGNKNSRCILCIMVCPSFWEDYYMLIYTRCWELMNSVGSHGNSSLPFVMEVMVCHFVSNSHEVMTTFIVVLPLIFVVEISLQLHWSFYYVGCEHLCQSTIEVLLFDHWIFISTIITYISLLNLIYARCFRMCQVLGIRLFEIGHHWLFFCLVFYFLFLLNGGFTLGFS
jgi:hypothetical protein